MKNVVEVALVALPRAAGFDTPTGGPPAHRSPHILITKRLPNTFYPGYWELPGGKIEPGESPEAAAVREAREELGIIVTVTATLPPIVHQYEHATVRLHTCICAMTPGSPAPADLQVAAHQWCPIDGLPWEEFLPANVHVVRALVRHFDARPPPGAIR